MIKVLGLALYGPLAASTRYRLEQYVPGLASMGIDLHIFHLLGDDYLRSRFNGGTLHLPGLVKAACARLTDLWRQHEYDIVILHCELFPLVPGWMERAMIRRPYIYDYDDAFYLKYRRGRLGMAQSLLGRKFDTVMEGAAAVTAGNHVLSQYAKQYNLNTQYLPTVVDTERYLPRAALRGGEVFTVGWIGSPSTAIYLSELVGPLSAIGQESAVRFIVVGGKAPAIPNVQVLEVDWNENTEVDLINSFDVGVMPLPDEDWTRGKCAFKLIQYMACAVPVIASPVGANFDVVNADCGLLASTPQEWKDALRMLRDQLQSRLAMGEAARDHAVKHFSLHQNLPVLAGVIMNIARPTN
jgi:glycosyltransferase involved in cell wall biosynthesis